MIFDQKFCKSCWILVLIGLNALLLWLLYPTIASMLHNNVGSVHLNRALLQPDLSPPARQDQAVQAGQSFQDALSWDALNGQVYYNLGALYDFLGIYPSAFRSWSRAAAINAHDVSSRFAFGQALAAQGREMRARQEWNAAGAALYFVNQGLTLAQSKDHEGALAQYQRALLLSPNLVEGHYNAGRALLALGRQSDALAAFEMAAALEPATSPRRYLLQAEVYTALGEWTAALAAYSHAVSLTPRDPVPHYRMGWVSAKLDDQEAAIVHWQRALELDAGYTLPRLALGQLYAERGECDQAADWLLPLLSPDAAPQLSQQQHYLLADCLSAQGRGYEAINHLEHVLLLEPDSLKACLALAQVHVKVRQYQQAIELYLQVLELQPDNAPARQALQDLGWLEASDEFP